MTRQGARSSVALRIAKYMTTTGLLLVILSSVSFAAEPDGAQLYEQARCYICHDADKVLIGPPLKAIAARHGMRKDVMIDVLARKIVQGGGGNWGWVPMVPNQSVSLAQARPMADWILNLKP
jgi:cytochrome c